MGRPRCWRFWPVALLVVLIACEQAEKLRDRFRDLTPRETYQARLADAGLGETALGTDWTRAGEAALDSPTTIALPFQETGHITPERPSAVGYRITIPRGRKLTFEVSLDSSEDTRLFIDLFRVPANEEEDPFRPIFSSDSVSRTFTHEPWRGGDFILRVQPELLRGGSYRVTLREEAQLGFPVEGRGMGSILSFFGASRDGGRREHHGVDVFAPRGTPVLSATDGRVRRVRETPRGGKVVWVREPVHEASLYYAHLDSQHVNSGQMVERGDTIGFVGNTGNARTTPPHLHFGLYRRGPIDPLPFLSSPRRELPELTADLALLGVRVRPMTVPGPGDDAGGRRGPRNRGRLRPRDLPRRAGSRTYRPPRADTEPRGAHPAVRGDRRDRATGAFSLVAQHSDDGAPLLFVDGAGQTPVPHHVRYPQILDRRIGRVVADDGRREFMERAVLPLPDALPFAGKLGLPLPPVAAAPLRPAQPSSTGRVGWPRSQQRFRWPAFDRHALRVTVRVTSLDSEAMNALSFRGMRR